MKTQVKCSVVGCNEGAVASGTKRLDMGDIVVRVEIHLCQKHLTRKRR